MCRAVVSASLSVIHVLHIHARVPEALPKISFPGCFSRCSPTVFKLLVHHETRDLQKYDLVVAKTEVRGGHAAGSQAGRHCRRTPPLGCSRAS